MIQASTQYSNTAWDRAIRATSRRWNKPRTSRSPMRFVVSTRARLAVISRSRIRRLALVEGEAGVEVLGVWSGRVVLGGGGGG